MRDFDRHRMDIEVVCACGHSAVLPRGPVVARFEAEGWYMGLNDGWPFGSPYTHFCCTRCRRKAAVRIGPGMR